jgi:hypothetical protein
MNKFNVLRSCPAVTCEVIRQIAMRDAAPFYPLPAGLGKRASLRSSSRGRRSEFARTREFLKEIGRRELRS